MTIMFPKLSFSLFKMRDWEKYPREVVVMNLKRHALFIAKCKELGINKSAAINALIQKWVTDRIKIKQSDVDSK